MATKYKHIFFDLDRTLWDFDSSAEMAFTEIFEKFHLYEKGIESVKIFQKAYNIHNEQLWELYRHGKIEKEILRSLRFQMTLADFGIADEKLAEKIGDEYLTISPLKVSLFPNAFETLQYLQQKYILHLITNGFSEVQYIKLKASGLEKYFIEIITSEEAGVKKPDARIFEYSLKKSGAKAAESLMIGDDYEVDVLGAKNAGIDQVLFDPLKTYQKNGSTFYINDLGELKGFL
ncbi:MAG TPA: YjjG family noncanonical pyrimidine nucleotidase [Bacteroidales bacterium]